MLHLLRNDVVPGVVFRARDAVEANTVRYDLDAREILYTYVNTYEMDYFTDAFGQRGVVTREGLSCDLFDLSEGYDAALDVDAYIWFNTFLLGRLNPGLPIFAFEPETYNTRVLR